MKIPIFNLIFSIVQDKPLSDQVKEKRVKFDDMPKIYLIQ